MKNSVRKSVAAVSAVILTASVCTGMNVFNNQNNVLSDSTSVSAVETESMRDISSQELVEDMGLGWNLGNDMDCYGTWVSGMETEGCWGNPKATKALIQKVKASGFKTVRIPVTWTSHIDSDGNIDEQWLARVQEIVDWCMDEGLYAIVNLHHDGNGQSDIDWIRNAQNDFNTTEAKYTKVWSQIADRFKDYSDYLVFESMNEVEFKDVSKSDAYDTLNKLNQAFVDTIRESGSNNAQRHLLIAGYITDIAQTCDVRYKVPDDPMNRCIVSVHYYTPSPFCVATPDVDWCTPQTTWGTDAEYEELETNFKKMYTNFVSKGTPVIIGEYGVLTEAKNGKDADSITRYLKAVSETAVKYGMCPVLWDASVGGDMNFIDRNSLQFNSSDIESMYKDVSDRIESGELKKDDSIKGDDTYKEVEVTLADGVSVDVSKYDKKPVGAKIYLSCSTNWDSYGGGAVHYDDGSSDWVYQEYGFNSVYDVIEMKFNDKVMSSMNNGTAKQLDFYIWWTALDNEADENSGHASELSFKDNKVVLLFENDSVPDETTTVTIETTTTTTESSAPATSATTEDVTTVTTSVSEEPVTTTTAEDTSVTTAAEDTSATTSAADTTSVSDSDKKDDVKATLLGDVNDDGLVDVVDVTALKQAILKINELTPVQAANANVITDDEPAGTIDVKDLGQLLKYIIKVIDKF